jgi:dihydrofolate reductase
MATVVAEMSMSLDGFVADTSDGIDEVFAWFGSGDVELQAPASDFKFRVSEASAADLREAFENVGAVLTGRRTFDLAGGWGGRHPFGVPTFVVTHEVPDGWPLPDSAVFFVTDGIESAVEQAKAAAGDKMVGIGGASVAQQVLNAGLMDRLRINLVPVLLGEGVSFFGKLEGGAVRLENPRVVEGEGVTHLDYAIRR